MSPRGGEISTSFLSPAARANQCSSADGGSSLASARDNCGHKFLKVRFFLYREKKRKEEIRSSQMKAPTDLMIITRAWLWEKRSHWHWFACVFTSELQLSRLPSLASVRGGGGKGGKRKYTTTVFPNPFPPVAVNPSSRRTVGRQLALQRTFFREPSSHSSSEGAVLLIIKAVAGGTGRLNFL